MGCDLWPETNFVQTTPMRGAWRPNWSKWYSIVVWHSETNCPWSFRCLAYAAEWSISSLLTSILPVSRSKILTCAWVSLLYMHSSFSLCTMHIDDKLGWKQLWFALLYRKGIQYFSPIGWLKISCTCFADLFPKTVKMIKVQYWRFIRK